MHVGGDDAALHRPVKAVTGAVARPLLTAASGDAAAPSTVPPRWFSKPVNSWVNPASNGLLTPARRWCAQCCGDVVTSSRPTPSTRSPDDVSYQCPSTWMAAQIASTGAPRSAAAAVLGA